VLSTPFSPIAIGAHHIRTVDFYSRLTWEWKGDFVERLRAKAFFILNKIVWMAAASMANPS
jgi:hypothetical protein